MGVSAKDTKILWASAAGRCSMPDCRAKVIEDGTGSASGKDVLIGETYQHTMDQQADFRPLVQAAKGSSCRIHGAIGLAVNSDRLKDGPIEITRAVASNCWDQGVDGL